MKKRVLTQHLRQQGCSLLRQGRNHEWWVNSGLGNALPSLVTARCKMSLPRKSATTWASPSSGGVVRPRSRPLHRHVRRDQAHLAGSFRGLRAALRPRCRANASRVRSWAFTPGTSAIQPIHQPSSSLTIAVQGDWAMLVNSPQWEKGA